MTNQTDQTDEFRLPCRYPPCTRKFKLEMHRGRHEKTAHEKKRTKGTKKIEKKGETGKTEKRSRKVDPPFGELLGNLQEGIRGIAGHARALARIAESMSNTIPPILRRVRDYEIEARIYKSELEKAARKLTAINRAIETLKGQETITQLEDIKRAVISITHPSKIPRLMEDLGR